jgi:hypothetical protein
MAAQQPKAEKSPTREIVIGVLLLLVGGVVTYFVNHASKDDPPAGPNSDKATFVLEAPLMGPSWSITGTGLEW